MHIGDLDALPDEFAGADDTKAEARVEGLGAQNGYDAADRRADRCRPLQAFLDQLVPDPAPLPVGVNEQRLQLVFKPGDKSDNDPVGLGDEECLSRRCRSKIAFGPGARQGSCRLSHAAFCRVC